MKNRFSPKIFLHGGAGALVGRSHNELSRYRKELERAAFIGWEALERSSSVDAVEAAVAYMEDCGSFNAGAGSCLTINGTVEMDAAIMSGRDLACGAVGAVSRVKNPIRVARAVMEETDHVLLVGDSASLLAKELDLDLCAYRPTRKKMRRYRALLNEFLQGSSDSWKKNIRLRSVKPKLFEQGTVGAVASDSEGNVASAVSTGGRWLKLPGRVGDSAIVGGGVYADNSAGAAAATGSGEDIMKICLAKLVCDLLARGVDPQNACERGVSTLTKTGGDNTGGVIAIDSVGRVGYAFNTSGMGRAVMTKGLAKPLVAVLPGETLNI